MAMSTSVFDFLVGRLNLLADIGVAGLEPTSLRPKRSAKPDSAKPRAIQAGLWPATTLTLT
jgi:hypothetical protein